MAQWLEETPDVTAFLTRTTRFPELGKTINRKLNETFQPSPMVENLLNMLVDRKRLGELKDIVDTYRKAEKKRRGISTAYVTSIRKLDEDEIEKLKAKLKRFTGNDVDIQWNIDPSILGGLRIQLGDRIIDGSLRAQLNKLRQTLLND